MTAQTPAAAEIQKWLRIRVRFFTNFWLRVRKKNAESCRSRIRIRPHLWLTFAVLAIFELRHFRYSRNAMSLPCMCDGQKMAPHVNKWSPLDGAHE